MAKFELGLDLAIKEIIKVQENGGNAHNIVRLLDSNGLYSQVVNGNPVADAHIQYLPIDGETDEDLRDLVAYAEDYIVITEFDDVMVINESILYYSGYTTPVDGVKQSACTEYIIAQFNEATNIAEEAKEHAESIYGMTNFSIFGDQGTGKERYPWWKRMFRR